MVQRKSADQVRAESGQPLPKGALTVGGQVMVPIDDPSFEGLPMSGENALPPMGSNMPMPPREYTASPSMYGEAPVPRSDAGYVPDSADEPIMPGGPPRGLVDMWKAQWGEIYYSRFDDDVYIWRCLRRNEYKEVLRLQVANGDAMYREERVCELCVLWPVGYNKMTMITGKAGTPTLLSEQIMDKSGFTPTSVPERL